jgi:Tfp pilus assembly protein PilF
VLVAAFALITFMSAAVWRSDVSAWSRVAALHPGAPTAYLLLGHAQREAGDLPRAERAYARAVELRADYADAHLGLARVYEARGEPQAADWHAQRFLQLAPNSPDGPALLAAMRRRAAS